MQSQKLGYIFSLGGISSLAAQSCVNKAKENAKGEMWVCLSLKKSKISSRGKGGKEISCTYRCEPDLDTVCQ